MLPSSDLEVLLARTLVARFDRDSEIAKDGMSPLVDENVCRVDVAMADRERVKVSRRRDELRRNLERQGLERFLLPVVVVSSTPSSFDRDKVWCVDEVSESVGIVREEESDAS